MSEIPFVDTEADVDDVEQTARNLIPWLEDPYRCDECNSYCYAEQDYVDRQAMIMDIWKCRECGKKYHRDEQL